MIEVRVKVRNGYGVLDDYVVMLSLGDRGGVYHVSTQGPLIRIRRGTKVEARAIDEAWRVASIDSGGNVRRPR